MDVQARVASLDRVAEFRAAYAKFGDAARQALLGVELEIRRILDWLDKDQVAFWKGEIRRREEKLNEAKAALHRKRITATFGHTVGDTDELVAVRKAQARLHEAEDKLKAVRQWYILVEQEVNEYRSPSQVLGNVLDADVPRGLATLDRSLDALDAYLRVTHPGSASDPSFASSVGGEAVGMPSSAGSTPSPPQADAVDDVRPSAVSQTSDGAA